MSGSRGSGFTVIEVMFFLAISGFLVVGIMAGAGTAINNQRYKDATNSLVSYIQGQYDRVANVQNDHDINQECTAASIVNSATTVTRGASLDCYIIGRLLTVSDGGKRITSQSVYAAADVRDGGDIAALSLANMFTSSGTEVADTYSPEWSTRLVQPKPNQETTMDGWRLLVVRSPSTGTIRTFTTTDTSLSLQNIVAAAFTRSDTTVCVDPSGLTAISSTGVKIIKDASGMSGVKMTNQGDC